MCGAGESGAQESPGALAAKPQAAKGPSSVGAGAPLSPQQGRGVRIFKRCLCLDPLRECGGDYGKASCPLLLKLLNLYGALLHIIFSFLLPATSLSTSSHLRGWLFKERVVMAQPAVFLVHARLTGITTQ